MSEVSTARDRGVLGPSRDLVANGPRALTARAASAAVSNPFAWSRQPEEGSGGARPLRAPRTNPAP